MILSLFRKYKLLSRSLLDINFEGESLLKMISREGVITGDNCVNRGLAGDASRE